MPAVTITSEQLPSFVPTDDKLATENLRADNISTGTRRMATATKPPLPASMPMSAMDRFFFAAEEPGCNNMTIADCWVFEDALSEDIVLRLFTKWTTEHSMFAQRPVDTHRWEAVADFDVKAHVHWVRLPAPYGRNELEGAIAAGIQEPLCYTRPLWKALVITNYNETNWVIALLVHHAYGDSIGAMRSLLSQALSSSGELHDLTVPAVRRLEHQEEDEIAKKRVQYNLKYPKEYAINSIKMILRWTVDLILFAIKWLMILILPRAVLTRPGGYAKEVALSDPIQLSDVKQIGKMHHVTVNDVLFTAITRTFHAYFEQTGQLDQVHHVRCLMPISLCETEDFIPGNKVTGVVAMLPIYQRDPLVTLQTVHDSMEDLNSSWESAIYYFFLNLSGWLPLWVVRLVTGLVKRRLHVVLTNVEGPRHASSLEGHKMIACYSLPPQPCPGGLGISIVTYHYKITVGVIADHSHLTPSAHTFIKLFHREFEALRSCARTSANACPASRGRLCTTCGQENKPQEDE